MDKEVYYATVYLYEEVIPRVATQIEANPPHDLISYLHNNGINCRHLGWLRTHPNIKDPNLKSLILTECVARTLKNEWRLKLRETTMEHVALHKSFEHVTFQYLQDKLCSMERIPCFCPRGTHQLRFLPYLPTTPQSCSFSSHICLPRV